MKEMLITREACYSITFRSQIKNHLIMHVLYNEFVFNRHKYFLVQVSVVLSQLDFIVIVDFSILKAVLVSGSG